MARALIAEPSQPDSAALRKFLESARHEVVAASSIAQAVEAMGGQKVPEVVFASVSAALDGEAVCTKVKAIKPLCPVVLVFSADEQKPEERAASVGADAFLLAPLKRGAVVTMAQAGLPVPPGFTITTDVCNAYRMFKEGSPQEKKFVGSR